MSFFKPPRGEEELPRWREMIQDILNGTRNFSAMVSIGAPKTGDYTIVRTDDTILADGTSNTVTITLLPAAATKGRKFEVKCVNDTFTVDIAPAGSETIDGDAGNFEMFRHEIATVLSDGSNWWLVR